MAGSGPPATHKNDLQKKIRYIESLLKEIPTLQDTARESKHIKGIIRSTQEAKTEFLDIQARHNNDTETAELDNLKSPQTTSFVTPKLGVKNKQECQGTTRKP